MASEATAATASSNNGTTSTPTTTTTPTTIAAEITAITPTTTNFAGDIFEAIAIRNPNENVIISPLLLEAMLTLLYLGSDGQTAEQLKQQLQLNRFGSNVKMANYYASNLEIATHETDTRIQLSNRILLDENCECGEEFVKIAQKYFHTHTQKCDMRNEHELAAKWHAAIGEVNSSSSSSSSSSSFTPATSLQLKTALDAATATAAAAASEVLTSCILLMAANFKNKWFLPFSAYRTGIYDFHVVHSKNTPDDASNGSSASSNCPLTASSTSSVAKPVAMLFDDDMFVKFAEFRELDARAIELPYEHDDEMAMLLILPNQRDGLLALEQKLYADNLNALAERMQMESVQVLVPKFHIDFECSLRPYLEKLGIASIFSNEANFKNLLAANCKENLQIADVLHKVRIEVNESGSDASNVVANKPIVISNSIDSGHKFFRADHPFYFAIRCRDVTYFVGHVTKFE